MSVALACYVPLAFFGFGANVDSAQIAESGRLFMTTGIYTPSRYPGFPVHEIPAAVLAHVGGAALSNLGTAAMATIAVFAFAQLLAQYSIPNRGLLTWALIANPVFWTSSTYTIDYVWSVSLLLVGFWLLRSKRALLGCVALGLATGSRASSLGFALALIGYQLWANKDDRLRLAWCAPLVFAIGAIAHVGTLRRYGFLRLYFGDWNTQDYLSNFLYGNMMLVGPQAFLALVAVLGLGWWRSRALEPASAQWWQLAGLCSVIVLGYEALFLYMPIQVGYLLPALPAVLLLLGMVLRHQRNLLRLWVALSTSAALVSINVISLAGGAHQVDSSLPPLVAAKGPHLTTGLATTVSSGVFVRWGYVVSDVAARANFERAR